MKANIAIVVISVFASVLFVNNVHAQSGGSFGPSWDFATSTGRTSSGLTIRQGLGKGDSFPIESLSAVQLLLGARAGDARFHLDLYCHNTLAGMETGGDFCATGGVTQIGGTGTTTTVGPTMLTFTSSSSIPFDSSKYYSLSIQEDSNTVSPGTTDWFAYGSASTTDPLYGKCYKGAASTDCFTDIAENTSSAYRISQLYYTVYGAPLSTRLVTPVPSWNEIIGLSTSTPTTYGGSFFTSSEDSTKTLNAWVVLTRAGSSNPSEAPNWYVDISGAGNHDVFSSFTFDTPGLYTMRFEVVEYNGPLSVGTIYSTSTNFVVGYVPLGSTTTQGVLIDSISDSLQSVDCHVDWSNWSIKSLVKCAWDYLYAVADGTIYAIYQRFKDTIDAIMQKPPFGYFYRVYYIFTHPDPSYQLPALDVHFRFGNVDQSVNFTPWSYLQQSVDTLYSTSSDHVLWEDDAASTSDSIGHTAENISNMIFGLLFVTYLVFRIAKFYI